MSDRLEVPEAGNYEVRLIYPTNPNRATNVPVEVATADGVKSFKVNQKEQSDPPFEVLGTFRFEKGPATVTLTNQGVDGYVLVDGVQMIKK